MSGESIPRHEKPKDGPKENTDHIIVEIGSGAFPFPQTVSAERRREMHDNPNLHYVGVDVDDLELTTGRMLLKSHDQRPAGHLFGGAGLDKTERMHFVRAQGHHLPFRDASVSEVLLRNVLGHIEIPINVRTEMLKEATRVLKPQGTLLVVERYTPSIAFDRKILSQIGQLTEGSLRIVHDDERTEDEIKLDEQQLLPDPLLDKEEREEDEKRFVLRLRKQAKTIAP